MGLCGYCLCTFIFQVSYNMPVSRRFESEAHTKIPLSQISLLSKAASKTLPQTLVSPQDHQSLRAGGPPRLGMGEACPGWTWEGRVPSSELLYLLAPDQVFCSASHMLAQKHPAAFPGGVMLGPFSLSLCLSLSLSAASIQVIASSPHHLPLPFRWPRQAVSSLLYGRNSESHPLGALILQSKAVW